MAVQDHSGPDDAHYDRASSSDHDNSIQIVAYYSCDSSGTEPGIGDLPAPPAAVFPEAAGVSRAAESRSLHCPSVITLQRNLENSHTASIDELQHIALCPDCVYRVRAFRTSRRRQAETVFIEALDAFLERANRPSPHIEWGERYARLLFHMIGQDADFEQWQRNAWKCSHTVARALRRARDEGAPPEDLAVIVEMLLIAVGAAASNRMGAPSRLFDGAWPIAQMVKEAAYEVCFAGPALYDVFARAVRTAVTLASERVQLMIVYTVWHMRDRGGPLTPLSEAVLREVAEDAPPAVRLLLGVLSRDREANVPPKDGETLLLHRVSLERVRAHEVVVSLFAGTAASDDPVNRLHPVVRHYALQLLAITDPVEALVQMLAFRDWLGDVREIAQEAHAPVIPLFRDIADVVIAAAEDRPGSTFVAMEACAMIRDLCPAAFVPLGETLLSARPVVRHGLVLCATEGYEEAFDGTPQRSAVLFRRNGREWTFCGSGERQPLDVFCHALSTAATVDSEVLRHLVWMHERSRRWCDDTMSVAAM